MFRENLKISCCRLCGAKQLTEIFSLGDQYVNDFPVTRDFSDCPKCPIVLVICEACKLVQLQYSAPQELLYARQYWYRSGVTETMKRELSEIVSEIKSRVKLSSKDLFLDIGANDGTLLGFLGDEVTRVACEPANNLIPELQNNADIVINDFWSKEVFFSKINSKQKCKAITAIGMFYDLENPIDFVSDIAQVLDDDGIFVAQLMTLAPMLLKNDLGNLCHEHLEFYSYETLVYLFEQAGLEIFEVSENDVNGGSYRLYARKYQNGSIQYIENTTREEIINFKNRVDQIKKSVLTFLLEAKDRGETVHIYGASTKGNCILQYFGIDSGLVEYAADRSPEKWGRYTVGTGIKIISEDESRALNPDYYLVLPWAFFDEMYARELDWRLGGGKFIVPFPTFRVV